MGTAVTKNGKGNKPAATGRLRELEAKIERARKAVWEMAGALKEIKENDLWRQTHGSWREYCEDRWEISREWAHQTINAVEVRAQLASVKSTSRVQLHVAQASELAKVPAEDRAEVWENAATFAEAEGKKSASMHRHLRPAIEEYREQKAAAVRPPSPPDPEVEAARNAHEAAHDMQRSADAFAIDVERLIPHLDHLAEDEIQGCAYKIVETVHAVISILQENGYLKGGVADAILVDSTVA